MDKGNGKWEMGEGEGIKREERREKREEGRENREERKERGEASYPLSSLFSFSIPERIEKEKRDDKG